MAKSAQKLLDFFEKHNGESFIPVKKVDLCVTDMISGIMFDKQCDTDDPNIRSILEDVETYVLRSYNEVQTTVFLDFFPLSKYFPFKSCKKVVGALVHALEVTRVILRQREKVFDPAKPAKDLLEALLHARNETLSEASEHVAAIMSEDHLITTINDMFGAGYESTTDTLAWAIQHKQQKNRASHANRGNITIGQNNLMLRIVVIHVYLHVYECRYT